MHKTVRLLLIAVTMIVALGATGSLIARAQGPTNDDWVRAYYMYDRPYVVPQGMWVWFKFDSDGDRTKGIEITLLDGRIRGLDFRVYTEEQVKRITEDKFVGRGNVITVPCDTGRCESQNLFWRGAFNLQATYYVAVMNPTNAAVNFRILIQGTGVSLGNEPPPAEVQVNTTPPSLLAQGQPTTTPPFAVLNPQATTTPPFPAETSTPSGSSAGPLATLTPLGSAFVNPPPPLQPVVAVATATPLPPVNNSPYFAMYVPDNRPQNIGANGELWYKFDYTGDRSKITITLLYGNAWGYDFKVYTSDQAFRVYTEDKFVGRGSAPSTSCDTGKCSADDLTWNGSFNTPGTYFVRVVNTKSIAQILTLQISGTAINILGQ